MQPIHVAENLVWFKEIKVQSKSRSNVTSTQEKLSVQMSQKISCMVLYCEALQVQLFYAIK